MKKLFIFIVALVALLSILSYDEKVAVVTTGDDVVINHPDDIDEYVIGLKP